MATTVTINSNYAGKVAGGYFLKAFKDTDAIKNGAITVYENVNDNIHLRKLESTSGKRSYTCGFVPAGSITLAEKTLTPIKYKDDFEICKEDFRKTWGEDKWGASAHNGTWDDEVMNAIVDDKLGQVAEDLGQEIWNSLTSQFEADSTVTKVDGVAITEDNVEAEIKKVIAAVPFAVRQKKNVIVSLSSDVAQAYNFLLISKGIANGLGGNANTSLVFGNVTLVEDAGLPENTIVAADPMNLGFATGSMADFNEIKLVDQDETLLNGKVAGTMVYSYDFGYVYGEEIVYYRVD